MYIFNRFYKINPHQLVDDLAKVFKFRLLNDKHVQGEYFLACPFHSNGQEKTASAAFSLVNKGKVKEGDFWCFGCHTGGHISSILIRLFGDKRLAEEWIEKMYGSTQVYVEEERIPKKIELVEETSEIDKPQIFDLFEEAYLDETSYYGKRGIPDELVQKFKFGYLDKIDLLNRKGEKFSKYHQVYMPVFNDKEQVIFYMLRSTKDKSFYLPLEAKKYLWGVNWLTSTEVVICESIFNAATCWKFGKQAVAMFGTGDDAIYQQVLDLPCRSFIVATDNDEAGQRGAKELIKQLKAKGKLVSHLLIDEPKKDINDFSFLTEEEFNYRWTKWLKRV